MLKSACATSWFSLFKYPVNTVVAGYGLFHCTKGGVMSSIFDIDNEPFCSNEFFKGIYRLDTGMQKMIFSLSRP